MSHCVKQGALTQPDGRGQYSSGMEGAAQKGRFPLEVCEQKMDRALPTSKKAYIHTTTLLYRHTSKLRSGEDIRYLVLEQYTWSAFTWQVLWTFFEKYKSNIYISCALKKISTTTHLDPFYKLLQILIFKIRFEVWTPPTSLLNVKCTLQVL